MQWDDGSDRHGHIIVVLDAEYIDLTLDQFPEYDDWITAEPTESGGKTGIFLRRVRDQGGIIITCELTLDGIPDKTCTLLT